MRDFSFSTLSISPIQVALNCVILTSMGETSQTMVIFQRDFLGRLPEAGVEVVV